MPLNRPCFAVCFFLAAAGAAAEPAAKQVIEPRLVHLRNDPAREWSTFPAMPQAAHLEARFEAKKNAREQALVLRQQDVKQAWRVSLNGKPLGELTRDEADMVTYRAVPPGTLADGENVLRIETTARGPQNSDDIRVGEISLDSRPVREALSEATLVITVQDVKKPTPARITIVDANGSRHEVLPDRSDERAVRTGVIYTFYGTEKLTLPAGKYTIYAGRGFEYSLAQAEVTLTLGQWERPTLTIRPEVPTPGYVACDTHIHTLTHSGHGDASLDERMFTLAGEGIELPIATDHNVHIDYQELAETQEVKAYFTPVIGNEVTTTVGHFNIFPIRKGARVPDFKLKQWGSIFDEIFATPDVKVVILNHARDLHGGTRPFGPKLHNAASGENIEGWPMRFNAMEIINSGATQTDPLQLTRDWMTLLNRGYFVTPVGSSDSHDVARYIVGQGRTYIRCDDLGVSRINVGAAVDNFLAGRVMVSYGLLTDLAVSGKYRGGDLASLSGDEVSIDVRVLGPHWVTANRVQLYANGRLIKDEPIEAGLRDLPSGVKWQGSWTLPRPKHDVHLVAVGLGPGIDGVYWQTAKPYQPTSPNFEGRVLGISGAVWLDADGDGRRSCAHDYAVRLFAETKGDLAKLTAALATYDAATAAQAADLYRAGGGSLGSEEFTSALKAASPAASDGFRAYMAAWRENERARAEK